MVIGLITMTVKKTHVILSVATATILDFIVIAKERSDCGNPLE